MTGTLIHQRLGFGFALCEITASIGLRIKLVRMEIKFGFELCKEFCGKKASIPAAFCGSYEEMDRQEFPCAGVSSNP
jgi:hypothetical protein